VKLNKWQTALMILAMAAGIIWIAMWKVPL